MAKDTSISGFTIEATTDALPTRRAPFSAELADRLFAVASANANGASNGIVYPSVEDTLYKEHSSLFRRALQSRLNKDTQRARIVNIPQSEDENDTTIKFSVVIAAYNPRGPRNVEDEDGDEDEGEDATTGEDTEV